jgi:hypothetical protein
VHFQLGGGGSEQDYLRFRVPLTGWHVPVRKSSQRWEFLGSSTSKSGRALIARIRHIRRRATKLPQISPNASNCTRSEFERTKIQTPVSAAVLHAFFCFLHEKTRFSMGGFESISSLSLLPLPLLTQRHKDFLIIHSFLSCKDTPCLLQIKRLIQTTSSIVDK